VALRRRSTEHSGSPVDFLIVGLGNPGDEYANTLHNVGAEAVARLANQLGSRLRHDAKSRSLCSLAKSGSSSLVLAFPQTYMNDSGVSVASLLRRHPIDDWAQLVVVHDELDLPPGIVRVKVGGGLAGHNGLRSITAHTKTHDYLRVRIGVGKPPGGKERGADHVLAKASGSQKASLEVGIERAIAAVEAIVAEGVDAAMTRVNAID
jgi:PTH1 family peptidyl-tRNA hydrolase